MLRRCLVNSRVVQSRAMSKSARGTGAVDREPPKMSTESERAQMVKEAFAVDENTTLRSWRDRFGTDEQRYNAFRVACAA